MTTKDKWNKKETQKATKEHYQFSVHRTDGTIEYY